ncbi:hypothetical protein ACFL08_00505 [Patescibacteria group bacterium]
MNTLVKQQLVILLVGTIFAWVNFGRELADWMNGRACTTGCPVGMTNPFLTPCFYGAVFFLVAFAYSVAIYKKYQKEA